MARIKTDQLREGMIVATDVKNMDDMLLLPAGAAVTERSIRILAAWGVECIEIEGSDDQVSANDAFASLPPHEQERLTSELRARYFKDVTANPVEQEIFRLALTRTAQQMRDGNSPE